MMVHLNYHTILDVERTFLFRVYIVPFLYILCSVCCMVIFLALVCGARVRGYVLPGNLGHDDPLGDILLFAKDFWS